MASTYATLQSNAHTTVYNLIKDNVTSATVIDGTPPELFKGTGYPYIIVRTPEPVDERIVFSNTFFDVRVPLDIEIWSFQESVVRGLSDEVRDTLRSNASTFETQKLFNLRIESSSINPIGISENKTAHRMILRPSWRFGG